MAPSRNNCCNGKATIGSRCIVESHVIVNNKKILIATQQCCYGEYISLVTVKRT